MEISRILNLIIPDGALASTVSPAPWPSRALAIGVVEASFPLEKSASLSPTMVNYIILPLFRFSTLTLLSI